MNVPIINQPYGPSVYDSGGKSRKNAVTGDVSSAKAEKIDFSDDSVSMQKVHDAVKKTPEVRILIVEEIKQRIKNNDYPIENTFRKAMEKMAADKIV